MNGSGHVCERDLIEKNLFTKRSNGIGGDKVTRQMVERMRQTGVQADMVDNKRRARITVIVRNQHMRSLE